MILDGLEITIASAVTGVLTQGNTLHLTSTQVGLIATIYLIGEVVGALYFGRLSDQLGRRSLFMITLGVYLIGAGIMILGGLAEVFFGVKAEGQSLESIAQPLSAFTEAADVHPLLKDRLEKKAS